MALQPPVQSVERSFQILELLCEHGAMGVTELSLASGLHKTTVFRLCGTLCTLGYIHKNPLTDKYETTLKLLKMSYGLTGSVNFVAHVRPFLERLCGECGETVHLVRRDGGSIVYIDKFESDKNSVRMVSRVGLSLPMIVTGVGKAILAELQNKEILDIFTSTDILQKTENTITDPEQFILEIEKIRTAGYAVDNEENELGVRCVAAAFTDPSGDTSYAFSVSAPATRMDDDKIKQIAELVLRAKKEVMG